MAEVVSYLNFLGLGGLGVFVWYLIRGLRERVASLTELAKEQRQVLDVVRQRAEESDRLSKAYKDALFDFQELGKKLEERRGELVKELEMANQRKDEELARLANLEIEEIEVKTSPLTKIDPPLLSKIDPSLRLRELIPHII